MTFFYSAKKEKNEVHSRMPLKNLCQRVCAQIPFFLSSVSENKNDPLELDYYSISQYVMFCQS